MTATVDAEGLVVTVRERGALQCGLHVLGTMVMLCTKLPPELEQQMARVLEQVVAPPQPLHVTILAHYNRLGEVGWSPGKFDWNDPLQLHPSSAERELFALGLDAMAHAWTQRVELTEMAVACMECAFEQVGTCAPVTVDELKALRERIQASA